MGDMISPKIFIVYPENIVWKMDWEGMRINIKREYLNKLQFAVNTLIISLLSDKYQEMLT